MRLAALWPWLLVAAALGLLLWLTASGPQTPKAGPVARCETSGIQCQLSTNKIGICIPAPQGGFTCMSQH